MIAVSHYRTAEGLGVRARIGESKAQRQFLLKFPIAVIIVDKGRETFRAKVDCQHSTLRWLESNQCKTQAYIILAQALVSVPL